jgi:hypothetical protein
MIEIGRRDERLLVKLYRFLDALTGSIHRPTADEARALMEQFPDEVKDAPPEHTVSLTMQVTLQVPPWLYSPTPTQFVQGFFEHHGQAFRDLFNDGLPSNVRVPYIEVTVADDP